MVISTLIEALAQILHMVINIYIWVVIISALITWVRPDPYNPIVQVLRRLTEPVYAFIRRYVPTVIGGVDLAPIIIIIGLQFLDLFAVKLLFNLVNAL
ncbi:YggT family protein [Sulfurospirillum arcachonense]|uniref:YggT family protein n=1 Tax=Sulfurospirillum arcachonense TaxID=57666 RepID=UPI0004696F13|nr:YggT family protein [Sulfurospirillum arcachonense]